MRAAARWICALPDSGLHRYGCFNLDLATGLEDDIAKVLQPPWNGGMNEETALAGEPGTPEPIALENQPVYAFEQLLQPTYHHHGFFNVRVADDLDWAS